MDQIFTLLSQLEARALPKDVVNSINRKIEKINEADDRQLKKNVEIGPDKSAARG